MAPVTHVRFSSFRTFTGFEMLRHCVVNITVQSAIDCLVVPLTDDFGKRGEFRCSFCHVEMQPVLGVVVVSICQCGTAISSIPLPNVSITRNGRLGARHQI